MRFPDRDLSNQFISRSYQDLVQQYIPTGSLLYLLDGYGNVVLQIPSASFAGIILTQDQTASYSRQALTASTLVNSSSSIDLSGDMTVRNATVLTTLFVGENGDFMTSDAGGVSIGNGNVFITTGNGNIDSTGDITANRIIANSGFTGSLKGDLTGSVTGSATLALTASFVTASSINGIVNVQHGGTGLNSISPGQVPFGGFDTSSLETSPAFTFGAGALSVTSILATTGQVSFFTIDSLPGIGILKVNSEGLIQIATSSVDYLTPTGSLFGTSSWSTNSTTALTASSLNFKPLNVTSASFASSSLSSSISNLALSASFVTASNVIGVVTSASCSPNASSASIANNSLTASFVTASNVIGVVNSASYVTTLRSPGNQGELVFNSASVLSTTASIRFEIPKNQLTTSGSIIFFRGNSTSSYLRFDPQNLGNQFGFGTEGFIIKQLGGGNGCLLNLVTDAAAPYVYIEYIGQSYGIFGIRANNAFFQHSANQYFNIEQQGGGPGNLACGLLGIGVPNTGADQAQVEIANSLSYILSLDNGDDTTTPGDPVNPAGWQHILVGGSEAWIPYYR